MGSLPFVDEDQSFPSEFQKRTLWRAATGLAILVLGVLLVGLIWLTSTVLGYLQPVFVPLALAGIIAYLLDPVVQYLQRKGLSRLKGIIIVFAAFVLFFGILFSFSGVRLSKQIQTVVVNENGASAFKNLSPANLAQAKEHGGYGWLMRLAFQKDASAVNLHLRNGGSIDGPDKTKWWLDPESNKLTTNGMEKAPPELLTLIHSDWNSSIHYPGVEHPDELIALENAELTLGGQWFFNLSKKTVGWLIDSSGKILGGFGLIIGFVMVPIYLYYFLKESEGIKNGWTNYVPLKASKFKDEVVETLREINGYLISFFRGQVLVAFIDGILVGIALTIFQLPYGLLIGVFMAFLGIIPYIGNIICLIPACIIAYLHGGLEHPYGLSQWGYVIGVLAIFITVQQINSLITAPKIVGDSVGLHPMTVIFSMLFWSLLLGGFLGALLAVPLTAAVKVLFRRYIWDRQTQGNTDYKASLA